MSMNILEILNYIKKFVEEAHKRGIYVIQDIVTNHTGNFISYRDGKYYLNDQSYPTNKPEQYPFNMNDYNDPEQRNLNIYHWPSEVKNQIDIIQNFLI